VANEQPRLSLAYFDGRSARAQAAEIWIAGGELHLHTELAQRRIPLREVQWPERQRHGQRQAQLPEGGLLSASDAAAWDAWAQASGLRDTVTVRWMQSWRHVGLSLLGLVLLIAAGWQWGVPLASDAAVRLMPPALELQIGEQALGYFDRYLLKPSELKPARQAQIRERFEQLLAAQPGEPPPAHRLNFRSVKGLGPNAFALPGGDIVLTDELVELMGPDGMDSVIGVLAHEMGHVQQRHGLRLAVRASLVGAAAGLVIGDFSSLLAGLPALLAQQSYSRDFEREADEHSRQLMRQAGISPKAMVRFFERLAEYRREKNKGKETEGGEEDDTLPISFASHPADAERIRFFSE